MQVNSVKSVKGPVLLAKAGVSFADAQWFYSQVNRVPVGNAPIDAERVSRIRMKVQAFLQKQVADTSKEVAYA